MFHKLHRRDSSRVNPVRGLSCDESGVYFGGDCPLVTPCEAEGRKIYRVHPLDEINKVLAAGFSSEVDLSRRLPTLEKIADLLTDGWLGLAQITALRMRLPELADDGAVARLRKANDLLRFNPNHKPVGPGGGQFTTGDYGGDADQSGAGGSNASDASTNPVPKLSYRTTSGGPDTRSWGTKFELSSPSVKGGYIIQQIDTRYELDPPESKLAEADQTFWEAFQVDPGSIHTTYTEHPNTDGKLPIGEGDDFWSGGAEIEGSHGTQIDTGIARFYEGLTAEELTRLGFAVGNVAGQPPNLMNTYNDPKLPAENASNAVVRRSRNRY